MAVSIDDVIKNITESGLLSVHELDSFMDGLPPHDKPVNALNFAEVLTRYGKLTQMQATAAYQGKAKGLILGDYVIMTQIGKGGMGQVYKARHRRMNRMVALKVLPPAATVSDTSVRRFRREVEMAARLTHPNIVTAYDANEHQGVHYLVMELVEGDNLSTAVKKNGVFSIDRALDVVIQAAEGLAYAHDMGIVHRDIKPSNLLIDKHGTVKILDLGLARVDHNDQADEDARDSLTQTNQVLGTVDFMSPEQSLNAREADHRADVYSLGCTFFRLLTGKNVYFGSTVIEKIVAHREKPVPSLREMRPDVSPELDAAFQRMLVKDPKKRTQTMRQVVADMQACLSAIVPAEPAPGTVKDDSKLASESGSHASATGQSRQSVTTPDHPPEPIEGSTIKPTEQPQPTEQEDLSINPPSAASEPLVPPEPPKTRMGLVIGLASALALVPLLVVLLAAPRPVVALHDRAAVISIAGDASRPVRPIPFAGEDAQGLVEWSGSNLVKVSRGGSAEALSSFFASDLPGAVGTGAGQSMLVSLAAYGMSDNGTPFLLASDFRDPDSAAGRVPLRSLLESLKALPTEWKVLILDAGPLPRDPRLGLLVNEFPRLLAEEVAATGDPKLWVLASYGPLETSNASAAWRKSLFAHFLDAGLRGQADLDANHSIDLEELARYVSSNVAEFVRIDTGGFDSQTPTLLWGGGKFAAAVSEEGKPAAVSPQDRARKIVVASVHTPAETARTSIPLQRNVVRLRGALERAWQLRDAWDARSGWNFTEYSPQFWRAFQEELIDYEWLLQSSPDLDDKSLGAIADTLEKDLVRLQDLLDDRKSTPLAKTAMAERLAAARPQVIVGVNDPSSIAMVPRFTWPEADPDVREVEGLARKLEEGLTKPKAAAGFPEFINSAGVRYGQMVELRAASRLLKRTPKLAWQTVEQALQTRGLGEQVAAATLRFGARTPAGEPWCPPWIRERVARADRLSHEADRELLYEPKIDEKEFLSKVLAAHQDYEQAWQDQAKVAPAMRLRNELLFRLPYYLRWHAATGLKSPETLRAGNQGPASEDLRQLIAHLKVLSGVGSLPSNEQLKVLEDETRALSALRSKIDRGLEGREIEPLAANPFAPGHLWRIRSLLATPLLSAPSRSKLVAALGGAAPSDYWFRPRKTDLAPIADPAPLAPADWQPLLIQAELEALRVELCDSFGDSASAGPSPVAASLQALKAAHEKFQAAPTESDAHLWLAYRKLGMDLKNWYRELPVTLNRENATLARFDLSKPADRVRWAAALDAMDFQLRFVDARDAEKTDGLRPAESIRQTQLQGLLLWQEERFLAAAAEARQVDIKYLRDMARVSRRQAEAIQAIPPRE